MNVFENRNLFCNINLCAICVKFLQYSNTTMYAFRVKCPFDLLMGKMKMMKLRNCVPFYRLIQRTNINSQLLMRTNWPTHPKSTTLEESLLTFLVLGIWMGCHLIQRIWFVSQKGKTVKSCATSTNSSTHTGVEVKGLCKCHLEPIHQSSLSQR